jgi:hypothetical protein
MLMRPIPSTTHLDRETKPSPSQIANAPKRAGLKPFIAPGEFLQEKLCYRVCDLSREKAGFVGLLFEPGDYISIHG